MCCSRGVARLAIIVRSSPAGECRNACDSGRSAYYTWEIWNPESKYCSAMCRVATLATASEAHSLLGKYVIKNQNIAQLCTVSQRLRRQLSAVVTLVTASAAQLLFGKYGIQDQEFLGYVLCRNACDSKSRVARLSAVATLATASAVHILLGNYVIQNQNIAQLCTVSQRLRQRVKRTFYLGNMSSRTKYCSAMYRVAMLATAGTAQIVFDMRVQRTFYEQYTLADISSKIKNFSALCRVASLATASAGHI
ncbi:hypothetical protein B0H14DRAFT_2620106 [Mycena olivaceomarginata]|nr:hypothetical protein B0H14DRAFT_2620106 [Mycena olivaceomarginata]